MLELERSLAKKKKKKKTKTKNFTLLYKLNELVQDQITYHELQVGRTVRTQYSSKEA